MSHTTNIISKETYEKLCIINKLENEFLKSLGKNWLSIEEQEQRRVFVGGYALTNEDRSSIEVYDFVNNVPTKYTLYISESDSKATTWTGEVLGNVSFAPAFKAFFGDTRQHITVKAINGKTYHGTYYKSAGDHANIKLAKNQ